MERNSNIIWGAILVVLGLIFLGLNLDWFQLDWSFREIARFWPLLLIVAGVAAFMSPKKSIYNATSALLIAFAIPLGIFTCVDNGVSNIKENITDNINGNFDIDIDDEKEDDYKSIDSTTGDRNKKYYAVEMSPSISEASLKINGGAAEFDLEESKNRLFEATTYLQYKGGYTLEEETKDGVKMIDFTMKNKDGKGDFNIDLDENSNINNDILLKLSTQPLWNIDMEVGAGEVDFDLSNYKVKKLKLETGVASIDLKLGDKQEKMDIDVKSGVAKVKFNVPENVGCEIRMEGGLNAKNFEDFDKIRDGIWQSKGYEKTTKKIILNVESGLSALTVKRY